MKKFLRIIAIVLLLLTAANAVAASILFITDTTGRLMGMSVAYLKYSPFTNFLIPAIVLLIVNGVLNFIAAFWLLKNKPNASIFVIVQGVLLSGWIIIQIIMVRDIAALHVIMFLIGVLLTLSGFILHNANSKNVVDENIPKYK